MAETTGNRTAPGDVLRCFVGAFLAPESARRLERAFQAIACAGAEATRRVPRSRPVPTDNLHVTLAFLGNTPVEALPDLLELIRRLDPQPVTVRAVGFVGLPRSARARNLVAELEPHARLAEWHQRLEAELGSEGRAFRPHVTVRRLGRPHAFRPLALEPPIDLALRPPALYRSDTLSDGARYRPVS